MTTTRPPSPIETSGAREEALDAVEKALLEPAHSSLATAQDRHVSDADRLEGGSRWWPCDRVLEAADERAPGGRGRGHQLPERGDSHRRAHPRRREHNRHRP